MEKIAVVGLGWLGLPLALKLKEKGYEILGTTTTKEKIDSFQQKNLSTILLDLNKETQDQEITHFFAETSICIITIPPSKSLFQSYKSQILKLKTYFSKETKFIFTSSTSVYSENVKIFREDSQVLSDFNFTSQLFQTEKALGMNLGKRLTILRLAGLFGENRNPAKFLAGKQNLKNANSPVNLVHQEDVISFILELIQQNIWGETINLCSSEHPSRNEFYTWMCEREKLEIPHFEEDLIQSNRIIDNQKSKTIFNYKFDSPYKF